VSQGRDKNTEVQLRAILASARNPEPDSETVSLIALRLRTIAYEYHLENVIGPAEIASAAASAAHFSKIHKKTAQLIELLKCLDGSQIPELIRELNFLSRAAEHSREFCRHAAGEGLPAPVLELGKLGSAKAGDKAKHRQHKETSLYLDLLELYGEYTDQNQPGIADPFYRFTKLCLEYLDLNIKIRSLDTFRRTLTEARNRRAKVEADKAKERAIRKNQKTRNA
jgi:hypothetical protein